MSATRLSVRLARPAAAAAAALLLLAAGARRADAQTACAAATLENYLQNGFGYGCTVGGVLFSNFYFQDPGVARPSGTVGALTQTGGDTPTIVLTPFVAGGMVGFDLSGFGASITGTNVASTAQASAADQRTLTFFFYAPFDVTGAAATWDLTYARTGPGVTASTSVGASVTDQGMTCLSVDESSPSSASANTRSATTTQNCPGGSVNGGLVTLSYAASVNIARSTTDPTLRTVQAQASVRRFALLAPGVQAPAVEAQVVPEPATVVLLAAGLAGVAGLGAARRRRA
jgi:hypothetical protein